MTMMKPDISTLMKGRISTWCFGLLLGALLMSFQQEAMATHIVGGDLTYRCLGPDPGGMGNRYEVRLTLRRDCLLGAPDAQFDDPVSIGFFDAVTNQRIPFILSPLTQLGGNLLIPFNADDTLNQVLISDCTIAGNDVCVHQTTYVAVVTLPIWANGYILAYQRCCRNASLNNVVDPLNTGMTLVAQISGLAQTQCNSSPQFGDYPPIYICVNQPIEFDHSAFDLEGDSLVYCLETPLAGASDAFPQPQPPPGPPYSEIVWNPPYDIFNPLGGVPLHIDPETGVITGTPNTIGQFVVGICVSAYKNGVLTGRTRRDFQYNVRACRDVPVADFSAPDLTCDGVTVSFTSQAVFADTHLWIFDYGNPGSATSTEINPTYTFPAEGWYDVALIVGDDDMICHDTLVKQIGVFNAELVADFTYSISLCTGEIVIDVMDESVAPHYPIVKWQWLLTHSGGVIADTAQHPTFTFDADDPTTVFISLVVTDTNGCTANLTRSFPAQEINLLFNPDADSICFGESVHLLLNGDPNLIYIWSPTNGLDLTNEWDPIAFPGLSTCYMVTVTDGFCTVLDTICVDVQQLPALDFTYETDCKSLGVTFTNTTFNGIEYFWDFGDPNLTNDTSNLVNPTYTYNLPGEYIVTLFSRDGCNVSITKTVTVNTITEEIDPEIVNCFQPSIELNPVFNPIYTYSWSPGAFLNDSTSPNPLATVTDDTEFCVTITEASLPGCEIVECVLVIIPDDFEISAGGDITSCDFNSVDLEATLTGNPNVVVVWKDENGIELGTGLTLTVHPDTTTIYYVIATDTLGCTRADTIVVFKPDPTFDIEANDDMAYCGIQTITLTATSLPDVTFEWFNANGELIGSGATIEVTPGSPACFRVIGTDAIGCQADEIVCLTPTFFDLDLTDDHFICLGDVTVLTVTDFNNQQLEFEWSPTDLILSGQGTSSVTTSPDVTTTYTVIVTNLDLGCRDTLTSIVNVYQFDPPDIFITADHLEVYLTESAMLEVNQDPGYGYSWTSSTGESVDPVYNPVVTPEGTTTYTVTVTDYNGCTGTASITITVNDPFCDERDIFIPNVFTPNNDSQNDVLYVRSNFVSTMELHIYNRWGEKVFTSTDINQGWDGTYKGKVLEPDVFGFYLQVGCPNQKTYFKKGNITLLH